MFRMMPAVAMVGALVGTILGQSSIAANRPPTRIGGVVRVPIRFRTAQIFRATHYNNALSEAVLYSFRNNSDGYYPYAGLLADGSGALYGTTYNSFGKISGRGVVYKLTPAGGAYREELIHRFSGADGQNPQGGLVEDSRGALYGTTLLGGAGAWGAVFKLTPSGTHYNESVLYSFQRGADGYSPVAAPIIDSNGILYGTASGGASGHGVVYKLTPGGGSYTYSVLYNFAGGSDGGQPQAGLFEDGTGSLYGTTAGGFTDGLGTVYKLTPSGNSYTESVLYNFQGGADGSTPLASVIMDSTGSLYGTTTAGGSAGQGTVFKLSWNGVGYIESILYSFKGGTDGSFPAASLIAGRRGALFGTTASGGSAARGTAFKLTPAGNTYTEKIMHSFKGGPEGDDPVCALIADSTGNLYGTTHGTPYNNGGSVFRLTPAGSSYSEKILHSFLQGDGAVPYAAVIGDSTGALFGTTYGGGAFERGSVYRLIPNGNGLREDFLYKFQPAPDGANPVGGLIADGSGALYGTTQLGGSANKGTVFKLTPSGNGYNESVLYSFQGTADGAAPYSTLLEDLSGALYGTAASGGSGAAGTVFKLTPLGGSYSFSILYTFTGAAGDGRVPQAGLLGDSVGNLFGTTAFGGANSKGTVFELTPSGNTYTESILHIFTGGTDGEHPVASLIADSFGSIYGTTKGGARDPGTVFKLTPSGGGYTYNVLQVFANRQEGLLPEGALLCDTAGVLYGTTSGGGTSGHGTVFELTPNGNVYTETVLYSFQHGPDGVTPVASLIMDSSGALYGTTTGGGAYGSGTVFKLIP